VLSDYTRKNWHRSLQIRYLGSKERKMESLIASKSRGRLLCDFLHKINCLHSMGLGFRVCGMLVGTNSHNCVVGGC